MKKLLIFGLLFSLILVSCSNDIDKKHQVDPTISASFSPNITGIQTTINPYTTNIPENPGMADNLNIIYPIYKSMRYYSMEKWQELMNEKFNIELNINYYLSIPYEELTNTLPNSVLYLNFTKGAPYEYNTAVYNFCNDNIAYNLSPYYKKYEWDKYIDSVYIDKLTINNKIFALPVTNAKYILPRYYNNEYLSKLNLDVPKDVWQFYNYLKECKSLNSSDSSFYPMCIFSPYLTKSTADIFRAFGVYVNSFANLTMTYNPNTDSFEDGAFSSGMEEALEYLRTLQHENLLEICGQLYYRKSDGTDVSVLNKSYSKYNKNFATEYGALYVPERAAFLRDGLLGVFNTAYESSKGYYLTGLNTKNVCEIKSDLSFYVFPKSNPNINKTINTFNEIFTDENYYANLRYGIDDVDFSKQEDTIIVKLPKIGAFLDIKSLKTINDLNLASASESSDILKNLSIDLSFEKNVFTEYHAYLGDIKGFNAHFQTNMIGILFDSSLSPYDALEEYKKMFHVSGLEQIINELNKNLGTVSSYDYSN